MLNLEPLIDIVGNDQHTLNSLIATFLSTTKEDIRNLESAVNNRQSTIIRDMAHRIKGGASVIGAEGLASLANRMETIGLNREQKEYDTTFHALKTQFRAIEAEYYP